MFFNKYIIYLLGPLLLYIILINPRIDLPVRHFRAYQKKRSEKKVIKNIAVKRIRNLIANRI
jgi:hypothetical protein